MTISVFRLDLENLDSNSLKVFDQLTPPQFQPCLRGVDPFNISDTRVLAIGAFAQGQPVGLALASLALHLHFATIHSLYVHPDYRRQKIGTRLLAAMEEELKKEKASVASITYPLGEETTLAFEKVLLVNVWKNTRPFMMRCVFLRDAFPRNWIQKPLHFPPSFQEFFWRDITEEDKKKLKIMQAQKIFPPTVSPFIDEKRIEFTNSLGLRHEGEVVGWIINHRIDEETIRYSSFFIIRAYRHFGYSIKLLNDSIQLQLQSSFPYGMLELPLREVNHSWIQFIQRRLLPHATRVTYINQAWKKL